MTDLLAELDQILSRIREMTDEANAACPGWSGRERRVLG